MTPIWCIFRRRGGCKAAVAGMPGIIQQTAAGTAGTVAAGSCCAASAPAFASDTSVGASEGAGSQACLEAERGSQLPGLQYCCAAPAG